jgi:hypothetical protein
MDARAPDPDRARLGGRGRGTKGCEPITTPHSTREVRGSREITVRDACLHTQIGRGSGCEVHGTQATLSRQGCVTPHPDRARLGVRSTRDPRRPITTHARSRPVGRLRRAGLPHVLDSCNLCSCKIKNNMLVLVTRLFRILRVYAVALGPVHVPAASRSALPAWSEA